MLHLTKRTRRATLAVILAAAMAAGLGAAGQAQAYTGAENSRDTPPWPSPVPTGTVADWAWTAPFAGLVPRTVGWPAGVDISVEPLFGGRDERAMTTAVSCLNVPPPLTVGQTGAELAAGTEYTVILNPGEFPEIPTEYPAISVMNVHYLPPSATGVETTTVDIMGSLCAAKWDLAGPIRLTGADPSTGVAFIGTGGDPLNKDVTARATNDGKITLQGIPYDGSPPDMGAGVRGWALTKPKLRLC